MIQWFTAKHQWNAGNEHLHFFGSLRTKRSVWVCLSPHIRISPFDISHANLKLGPQDPLGSQQLLVLSLSHSLQLFLWSPNFLKISLDYLDVETLEWLWQNQNSIEDDRSIADICNSHKWQQSQQSLSKSRWRGCAYLFRRSSFILSASLSPLPDSSVHVLVVVWLFANCNTYHKYILSMMYIW